MMHIIAFQEEKLILIIPLNTWSHASMSPHLEYMSLRPIRREESFVTTSFQFLNDIHMKPSSNIDASKMCTSITPSMDYKPYAAFTYMDYEVLNHHILLGLVDNNTQSMRDLWWDEDTESKAYWTSWIDTDLTDDDENLGDPLYKILEVIKENLGDAKRFFIFSSSHDSLVANLNMIIPSATLAHGSKCPSVHGFVGCLDTTLTIVSPPPYHPHDPGFLVHEVATIKGDKESSWRRNQITSSSYYHVTSGLCISGVVYYAGWAPTQRANPLIVCVHIRSERLSLIQAPRDAVVYKGHSVLIEYKGKLASIVRNPRGYSPVLIYGY
ncbi:unnamed protein product [Arabis nemorensis]|uniref:F-box associated beta-propeller type 3 domain-containing protein n=1 Tax=Arabis nemorensis TaxID=586526 RepID=A0A565ANJ8_9BRAS|nr:unnamed protein product [Arabis nemorensis]